MSIATVAVNGVSFLNQDCVHLLRQMVFKMYAEDLDLHDRGLTRRQSRQRLDSQIHCRQILPAISVNKLRSDAGRDACEPHVWMRALQRDARAPQKENQCLESYLLV